MEPRELFAWVEKYRPQTLKDCILSQNVEETLRGIIAQQDTPHLLFTGTAGVGKTTVAKALVSELGSESMVINASMEGLIDVLRNRISDFASAYSYAPGRKYVILDEADHLSHVMQPALRGFMEQFAATTCFIFTCNFPQRIIDPLRSRCSEVNFKIPQEERAKMLARFTIRARDILTQENITFDKQLVAHTVNLYFPDFRRTLNELQRYSSTGTLSTAILTQMSDADVEDLFGVLKSKSFDGLREWVAGHEDMDATAFYHMLYQHVPSHVASSTLPELIIIMADYAFRSGQCADQQLNALACLTELMDKGQWK
jgi:DNA polymerase III delta prime subunit